MAIVNKEVIFLGNFADADTNEANAAAENSSLFAQTFGSLGDPLSDHVVDVAFDDVNNDGSINLDHASAGTAENTSYSLDGGATTSTTQIDSLVALDAVVTYGDGTTASFVGMVVYQDQLGNMWLANSAAGGPNINGSPAKPIVSITTSNVDASNGASGFSQLDTTTMADFYQPAAPDGTVDGENTGELMELGYDDANFPSDGGGDVITNSDDVIAGNGGDDTIDAAGGDDSVEGGAGADFILGGADNDTVKGGIGNDTLYGDFEIDSDYGVRGNPVAGPGGDDELHGGDGADEIYGGSGDDSLYGDAGNDTIVGGHGDDLIEGGDGDDDLEGLYGADTIYGGAGNDHVFGRDGADLIFGGEGDDVLIGSIGIDTLYGGDGNDTLAGSQGSDLIYGGDGNDLVYIGVPAAGDIAYDNEGLIYLEGGNDVLDAGDATLKFEAHGGDGNDTMRAGVGHDTLTGGADDDRMSGGAGNDLMSGDEGNDDLTGDEGDDTIDGGGGDDTFNYENGFGHDTILGGEAGETSGDRLDAGDVTFDSVLDLSAGSAADPEDGILTVGDTAEVGEHMVRLFKPDLSIITSGVYPTGNIDFTQGEFFYVRVADLDAYLHDSQGMLSGGGGGIDTTQNFASNFDGLTSAGDLIGAPGSVRHLDANGNQFYVGVVAGTANIPNSTYLIVTDAAGGEPVGVSSAVAGSNNANARFDYASFTAPDDTITFSEIENFTLGSGSDKVIGSTSDDTVSTGAGADTVIGGAGDDSFDIGGGDGVADTVVLADGDGSDTITGFEAPTDNGDGTFDGRDQVDVSGLTDAGGNPVNTQDVVVTDTYGNGYGHAILTFPNGESLTLFGVTVDQVATPAQLEAIGIPTARDYIVEGTAAGDVIDDLYTGDLDGDMIDNTDNLTGSNDDLVYGFGGGDAIQSGVGNDTVDGGIGNDTIDGGTGDDVIAGGAGDDVLSGSAGNDLVQAGDGNDTVNLSGGDTVLGESGDDLFAVDLADLDGDAITITGGETGETTGDTLSAATVTTGITVDLTAGGTGADSESGTMQIGSTTITFTEVEAVETGDGDDSILGSDGDDIILTNGGVDTIDGGAGDDSINLGAPSDRDTIIFSSGDGNDTLTAFDLTDFGDGTATDQLDVSNLTTGGGAIPVNTSHVTVTDTNGDGTGDAILGFPDGESITLVGILSSQVSTPAQLEAIGIPGSAPVDGTAAGDVMNVGYVDAQGDEVDGADGLNDTIFGYGGDDTITAGQGDDWVIGGDGNDSVLAGTGADTVFGEAGADTLSGGDDNDSLYGGAGADDLAGDDGEDQLFGGDDDDVLAGGAGMDTLSGDAGNDTLRGGDGDDTLFGGAGNDSLVGDAGQDSLLGGDGDDTLIANDGMDTLLGEGGDDTFTLETGFMGAEIFGGETDETVGDTLDASGLIDDTQLYFFDAEEGMLMNGMGFANFTEIENITLGSGNDSIMGSMAGENVSVGAGADTVYGGGGDDTFDLGADGDVDVIQMYGMDGHDTLTGFDAPIDNLDGTYTGVDQFDVQYMPTPNGDPFNVSHVTVTDDGSGNAVLTFAGGEAVTLIGVDPVVAANPVYLVAMGIPAVPSNFIVDGTSGNDTIDAGYTGDLGGDRVDAADNQFLNNDDEILAGAGDDVILSGDGMDMIFAGDGDDTIDGGAGDDMTFGEDGDDTAILNDGFSNDYFDGGSAGETDGDTIDLSNLSYSANVVFSGSEFGSAMAGTNTLNFYDVENIIGTDLDDVMDGTASAAAVNFVAGAGSDTLIGGIGDDSLIGGEGDDSIDGGFGNDTIRADEGDDTINGGDGDDSIFGFEGSDSVDGGDGDDFINTRTSPGTGLPDQGMAGVYGSDSDPANDRDTVFGGAGNDTILTGDDDDLINGGTGADSINAGFDDDTVTAGDGDDTVLGSEGNDSIDGGEGNDLLFGGEDTVTVDLTMLPDAIDLLPGNNRDTISGGDGDDTIFGMDDADLLYGDAGADSISGGIDNDTIYGGDDNDTLSGDQGDDLLEGGSGDDSLLGGDGDDALSGDEGADTLDGGAGDDQLYGGDGTDSLVGGDGDDGLYGGADGDTLVGGAGVDTLDGGAGDDLMSGGGDDDALLGGAGNDTMAGDAGNDTLTGGAGDDSLSGGSGADRLIGGDGADTMAGGDDRDYFVGGIGDVIDGNEGGDDYDTLDLTSLGGATMTNVIYDVGNSENGTVEVLDGTGAVVGSFQFSNIEKVIPCFTPGTMIRTDKGDVAVENLKAGAKVQTRDNGYQTIRWIGRRDLGAHELAAKPCFNPVMIKAGALGQGLPERDMTVSPQHRMLFVGSKAEMLFGQSEVLIAALHLVNDSTITRVRPQGVSYIHLLFDNHEIIIGNGAWTESYQLGEHTLDSMEAAQHEELLALFPELGQTPYKPAARISLKAYEAKIFCG